MNKYYRIGITVKISMSHKLEINNELKRTRTAA